MTCLRPNLMDTRVIRLLGVEISGSQGLLRPLDLTHPSILPIRAMGSIGMLHHPDQI